MRAAELDAVTLDALGTLIRLRDPVEPLREALEQRGVVRSADEVGEAFAREVAHYKPRCSRGRDAESLAALRQECVAVFLEAADAELPAESFVAPFLDALVFEPEPGAPEAVARLAGAGLELAVVSNWDVSLASILAELDLGAPLDVVVTSAEAGADKPDAAIFGLALERLETTASRTLHVGDGAADEEGARRAGLRFRPAPLVSVAAELLA